jgi:hypothetical protein
MLRRLFFKWILTAVAPAFFPRWLRAQSLSEIDIATLREVAAVVLPTSLGRTRTDNITNDFVEWIRNYKDGAEASTGYGFTSLRSLPPNPSVHYSEQLKQLNGGSSLAALDTAAKRGIITEALRQSGLDRSINVVEAGRSIFDFENRDKYRERMIKYGENPWPGDFIEDQSAEGGIARTMAVGGQALHWGGTCNRFSIEDIRLKSIYGLAVDWPIEWDELERYYCEAERRLGVSGEPSPFPEDRRTQPYPMKPMPLTWNLIQLKAWGEKTIPRRHRESQRPGRKIHEWARVHIGHFRSRCRRVSGGEPAVWSDLAPVFPLRER